MPIAACWKVAKQRTDPGRGCNVGRLSEIELREVVDPAQQRGVVAADAG